MCYFLLFLASEADEESESRAASLFRNQLLKGPPQPNISNITTSSSKSTNSSIPQVNVVQKEPRVCFSFFRSGEKVKLLKVDLHQK